MDSVGELVSQAQIRKTLFFIASSISDFANNITKWFVVLHHTMKGHRSVGRGNARCRAFWPWPPFANNRRRAGVMCFIVSEHVFYLEIQCASRSEEEGENW